MVGSAVHHTRQLPSKNGRQRNVVMWLTFSRWHFQMGFLEWKSCILILTWLKFVPRAPNDNKLTLVQVMYWHLTGKKPLLEPMLTQIYAVIGIARSHSWTKLWWISIIYFINHKRNKVKEIKENCWSFGVVESFVAFHWFNTWNAARFFARVWRSFWMMLSSQFLENV